MEQYNYSRPGQRARKIGEHGETRYLPGLWLGQRDRRSQIDFTLQVAAGLGAEMVLFQANATTEIRKRQWRYAVRDLTGSCRVETDAQAALLTQEAFYPFGGTAVWMSASPGEASRKRRHYCGRERDASGLHDYGHRAYGAWLGRWISADPTGALDGLNLFAFVRNNPISNTDRDGRMTEPANDEAVPGREDEAALWHAVKDRLTPSAAARYREKFSRSPSASIEFPKLTRRLAKWASLSPPLMLVHSVRHNDGALFEQPAETVLAQWDVVSTSLMDLSRIGEFSDAPIAAWDMHTRDTGAIADINFVLEVPPQNILGTHDRDVYFPNHAGVDPGTHAVTEPHALADAILGGIDKNDDRSVQRYNIIKSPNAILRTSPRHQYSEILVVGRPGVSLHADFRPTERIRVSRLVVAARHRAGDSRRERDARQHLMATVDRLRAVNPGLPVRLIP